ncbi:MAG: TIGR02265 family protein [Myxococcaceae bacterium]
MDTSRTLALRIQRCTDRDVILGMFFETTLARYAELKSGAEVAALRKELSGKDSYTSFFRYPARDLLRLLEMTTHRLGSKFADYIEDFGRSAVKNFLDSPIGKTMLLVGGDSPNRLVASAPAGFRACTSYGERSYQKTGDRSGTLRFTGELLGPAWPTGNVKQAIEMVYKISPKVVIVPKSDDQSDFELQLSW